MLADLISEAHSNVTADRPKNPPVRKSENPVSAETGIKVSSDGFINEDQQQ
jgi:hypothetical protein